MFDSVLSDPRAKKCYRGIAFASEIDRYLEWMHIQGYKRNHMRGQFWRLVAFSRYLKTHGIKDIREIPGYISSFAENWVTQECQRTKNPERLSKEVGSPVRQFIRYLEREGIIACPVALPADMDPSLFSNLCSFVDFLRTERALREPTIELYKHYIRRFLYHIQDSNVSKWRDLKSEQIHDFLKDQGIKVGRRGMHCVCCALRSFLRFLRIEGYRIAPSIENFHRPRIYRQEGAPRFLDAEQVQRVLESINRDTPEGLRDYPVILLLVTYGMRASDVARLTLDDLDWEGETIHLKFRKSGRSDVLPLSHMVGEAILKYLQKGRPKTSYRQIFLTLVAPYRPFKGGRVSTIAHKYLLAAGISHQRMGAHTLRYTSAHHLLEQGIPYKVIGDYLGHSSVTSTSVYLQVDIEGLLQVALNDGEDLLL